MRLTKADQRYIRIGIGVAEIGLGAGAMGGAGVALVSILGLSTGVALGLTVGIPLLAAGFIVGGYEMYRGGSELYHEFKRPSSSEGLYERR
jgi:hypothetical protein